jgi:coenzyme F420 hydrogenase subunit beta
LVRKNIQHIVNNALCTACGGCQGVCPINAISLEENTAGYIVAKIDFNMCINCEKCYQVCPSVIGNTPKMENVDIFHGEYIEGYVGYATDKEIRQESQSGGIVTALLCYLLKVNAIDGTVVNQFSKETTRPKAIFVDSIKGIRDSAGSYYVQSSVVNEILKHQDKRTAAVVLGCQGESINLIKTKYPHTVLPEYLIGLICAGQHSGNYIDQIIKEAGCNRQAVTKFRFRDKSSGGWPGNIKVCTESKNYLLKKEIRHALKPVFELYRCMLCFDQMNIFTDITVGDPWGITSKCELEGNTVIIARTEKGKKLIENAYRDGAINVEKLPVNNIIRGQTVDSRLKTQFFTSMNLSKKRGYMVPFELDYFKHISYENANNEIYKSTKFRLEYSRQIYLEEDKENYKRIISKASKKIKFKMKVQEMINFPKRCVGYTLRSLKQGLKG